MTTGLWDILIPKETTNYVKNPSFENSTVTGWTASSVGAGSYSAAVTSNYALFGIQSLDISCTGVITVTLYQDVTGLTMGDTYNGSVYVLSGAANTTLTLSDGGGTSNPTTATNTGSTSWERLTASKVAPIGGSIRVTITVVSSVFAAVNLDGVMLENSAVGETTYGISTYFDGDTHNCTWNGTRYTSASQRPATASNGGIWVDLQTYSAYVTSVVGLGIGDNALTMVEHAIRNGGEVRQVRIPSRNFTLGYTISSTSQSALHTARQRLENLFRSSRFGGIDPVYFRYRGASKNIIIPAIYEGGMSYVQVGQDGYAENIAARFVLQDAMLLRETQGISVLNYSSGIFTSAFNIARFDGEVWSTPGIGFNNTVSALAEAYDGTIYAAGGFTDTGGGEAFNRIAQFDGDTWSAVDGGMNGYVYSLDISSNGDLYAGGSFTTASDTAVTVNRVAKYSSGAWSALDGGVDALVYAVKTDDQGGLYAGGMFSSAGSTPVTVGRLAKYSGDTWSAVPAGDTGADGAVYALEFDASGNLYAGGDFATIGGISAAKVAKFNGTTWAAMGSGFNAAVTSLLYAADGYLYAAGPFTDTGGGETINSVARWNGTAWESLGSEALSDPRSLAYRNGLLYIGAGGIVSGMPLVRFNGSNFFTADINIPGAGQTINAILPTRTGNRLWIAGTLNDTTSTVAAQTVVTNSGTGDAQPKLTIIGSGTTTVYWLENQTTGQIIYLDLAVLNGERVTLDFKSGTIESSLGRNVSSGVLNGSEFGAFQVVSGSNYIAAFAATTGTPKLVLSWGETEIGL